MRVNHNFRLGSSLELWFFPVWGFKGSFSGSKLKSEGAYSMECSSLGKISGKPVNGALELKKDTRFGKGLGYLNPVYKPLETKM